MICTVVNQSVTKIFQSYVYQEEVEKSVQKCLAVLNIVKKVLRKTMDTTGVIIGMHIFNKMEFENIPFYKREWRIHTRN